MPRLLSPSDEMLTVREGLEKLLLPEVTPEIVAFGEARRKPFLQTENIVGVGIGAKYVGGMRTDELCLRVYVRQKFPPDILENMVAPDYRIQPQMPQAKGLPTDVVEVGDIVAQANRAKFRPAPGGSSLGHPNVTAGTLGCLLTDGKNVYILSNNHVVADCNAGQRQRDRICQPGPADGGSSADEVGTLWDYVDINFGTGDNEVDLGYVKADSADVVPFILQVGEVRGRRDPLVGLSVKKMGRTTLLTEGVVDDIALTVTVGYDKGRVAKFKNCIAVVGTQPGRPFSLPGDSGSLVLDEYNFASALLFAGDGFLTLANPIGLVLRELQSRLGSQADLWMFRW